MKPQSTVWQHRGIMAALILSLCEVALGQQSPVAQKTTENPTTVPSTAALDQMISAGKSQRELAQYLFDTHGCKECHTIGNEGKLGFTKKREEKAQGFLGCIATLKAMSIIAKIPEDQRSATQRGRVQRFEEFGCSTCHKLSPGKMELTALGAKLSHLHLGCVEVQKVLSTQPALQR